MTTQTIAAWFIPPGSILLLAAGGAFLLAAGRRRSGAVALVLSCAALYALSTNIVANGLLALLEPAPLHPHADTSGSAIVVLGGGSYFAAPEYGVDTVSDRTLERLRYAARLHRALNKPLLVTGGAPEGNAGSEAKQMRETLQLDFHVPVKWSEGRSNNTLENALLSRQMLAPDGIDRIYLVTHAWHMPRARLAFEHAGFTVIPAPTGYATDFALTSHDFLPSALALRKSRDYFHEVFGIGWYHLRLATGL